MAATFLDEAPDGVTFAAPSRLRRAVDTAHAAFLLGVAAAVHQVLDSEHPDLAVLDERGLTVTGRGADRLHAALDLVTEEFARHERMPYDAAAGIIHTAYHQGSDHHTLWTAVAEARITRHQARTIEARARRLAGRVAVLSETTHADGSTSLSADEGEPLLSGDAHTRALQQYLTAAVAHAEHGHTGRRLTYRLDQVITGLTPGYRAVEVTQPRPAAGLHVTAHDDTFGDRGGDLSGQRYAHVTFLMPLADALRFQAHVAATADASADDATARGVTDPRTHGQRQCDVVTDLLRDAMDRHVPAHSDPAAAEATTDGPTPARQGRTHRPASSVQVHVRIDASTLLRADDDPAWVDGVGPVPAAVARDLAGAAGAQWRALTLAPGTRHVLDVAADTYRPGAALRRYVTARDETCTAPAARSRQSTATSTTSSPSRKAPPPQATCGPSAAATTGSRPSTCSKNSGAARSAHPYRTTRPRSDVHRRWKACLTYADHRTMLTP
ncbi:hypothetical protein AB1207_20120 [Kineococcus endophyticus]|uniref:DUF222 domain-containing protein n=1 Tax=Kineococcus endophyticus TaxID=1181883 RepID=A0ABV3PBQ4_9ACTN